MRIGANVERRKSVTSTNDVAREMVLAGAPEGTVVTAEVQTAGRGSRGRKWLSPPGANLLASIVLYPKAPAKAVEMSFVSAVAVGRVLRELGLDAAIKWPNDVLVRGRKIAGILTETVTRLGNSPAVVVGIGINVNWTEIDPEIADTATSAAVETGNEIAVDHVLDLLMKEFGSTYELYQRKGLSGVMPEWREMECTIGRPVRVTLDDRVVKGTAVDVDSEGGLIVRTDEGLVTVTAAGALLPEDKPGDTE